MQFVERQHFLGSKKGNANMDFDINLLKENFHLRNIEVECFDTLNEIKFVVTPEVSYSAN